MRDTKRVLHGGSTRRFSTAVPRRFSTAVRRQGGTSIHALLVTMLLATPAAAQQPPAVFAEIIDMATATTAASRLGVRQKDPVIDRRFVSMRLDAVFGAAGDSAGQQLTLNLPSGARTATLSRVDEDATNHRSWVGTVDGVDYSHVVFTERDGIVSGLIDLVGTKYQLRTIGDGVFALEQLDQEAFGQELQPLTMTDAEIGAMRAAADPAPATDDAGTIDVLILYTPAARANRGGTAQVQALASQIIADSNAIYSRSGITTRLRLVGTSEFMHTEESDPPGEPGIGMSIDLSVLTDSVIVRNLRNDHRADVVQLLEFSTSSVCGIGWLLPRIDLTDFNAYSIADVTCVAQYTPTHEIGHNLGSHHDPQNAGGSPLFSYSYGYQDPQARFRTVMAYNCPATCPRIMHMSNPAVNDSTSGQTTGTSTQNNALSINNAASVVANWRQGGGTNPPVAPTGLQSQATASSVTISWSPSANAIRYILQAGNTSGSSNLYNASVGAQTTLSSPLAPGTYFWRVIAVNNAGPSAPSAEAQFTIVSPPSIPTNLQSVVTGNNVTLSWSAVTADAAASAATGYTLQVGTTLGTSNLFNAAVGNLTSVSGTVAPGTYFWRVRATNSAGSSAATADRQFTVGCTLPGAPTNFAFTLSGRVVTLTWTAPTTGAATNYLIEAGSATGLANLVVLPTGSATPGAQALAPSGTFFVRIRGQNACGNGPVSNERVIVVP
jgi:hypothetical protein